MAFVILLFDYCIGKKKKLTDVAQGRDKWTDILKTEITFGLDHFLAA